MEIQRKFYHFELQINNHKIIYCLICLSKDNSSIAFTADEIRAGDTKVFTFSAYYWGYVPLYFYGTPSEVSPAESEGTENKELLLSNDTMVRIAFFIYFIIS